MESIQDPSRSRPTWPIPAVYSALAVTSLAAAGIHFAVMGEHFAEYVVFGLFFSVVAWLQALWALGVVVTPTRPLLIAGLVGNAVVVAIWVVSRTAGLPIGPDAGTPEPAAFLDVLSTLLEVVIVVAIATLLAIGGRARTERNDPMGSIMVAGLALALVLVTTAAVASGADEEGGHGGAAHEATTNGGVGLTQIELSEGRTLQALIDASSGATLMHLTFFDAGGGALGLESLSVIATSASGDEVSIPFQLFEPGHYAATLALEPGEWGFDVRGVAVDGGELAASFYANVE